MDNDDQTSFISWWEYWLEKQNEGIIDRDHIIYFGFVLWWIWGARNAKIFRQQDPNGENVVQSINLAHTEWISPLEKTQGDQNLVDCQLATSTNN